MTTANPNPTMNYNSPDAHASTTNPVLIIAAWLLVGLPLAWGVSQTFLKSLDLFRAPAANNPRTYSATRSRGSERANRGAIRAWTSSRPAAHPFTSDTLRSSTTRTRSRHTPANPCRHADNRSN